MNRQRTKARHGVAYHILIGSLICIALVYYLFKNPENRETSQEKQRRPQENARKATHLRQISIAKNASLASRLTSTNNKININHLESQMVPTLTTGPTHPTFPETTRSSLKPIDTLIEELFELAHNNPDNLILALNRDPFGTTGGPDTFVCPSDPSQRITSPDLVDHIRAQRFRNHEEGTWIFFQHLRKAGGTSFCDLAISNMGRAATPPYFCMPDDRGSLAISPWSDGQYISNHLKQHGFRVACNEWDAMEEKMLHWPGAVFGTTIRDPIDRWYSQYRFEHLEHRDSSKESDKRLSFRQYYNSMRGWTITSNYYVKTFLGDANTPNKPNSMGDFYWTYRKYEHTAITKEMFMRSLQNFLKLHFIIVLEYISTASVVIEKVLGWTVPPKQVLPHEQQAKRGEKKSVKAVDALSNEDYHYMLLDNIYDKLFFEIVKRIYLERLKCDNDSL